MKELYTDYLTRLYYSVPEVVYFFMIAVLYIGSIFILILKGFKRGCKYIILLLLAEYVFLLFCSTLFFRKASERVSGHDFSPFWSYKRILEGKEDLLVENVMNVVAFVPVGILLGGMVHGFRIKARWALLIALAVGIVISLSIEALQFFLKRGFTEIDDVMHNTLGCLIGFGVIGFIGKVLNNHYNGK